MINQTMSHYKILEKLGEGGMGIVYKAHDTKLDRDVALKFLPASVVSSPEDVARFEQEARAISALNHPNIATIFDIDEADGKKFLVLEYIAGGTLKSKLKKLKSEDKEFTIAEVIDDGIQIADGLAHAHRQQIVHRDIKSDNVMLTGEGKVKITDFGLAKLRGTTQLTKTGSTIGTLAYMAPEQLRGEDIDHRADLFSLGVVLYEMTTLRLPFRGEHEAALTYSIANEEPAPVKSLRQNIPPALEQVIAKCLHKDRTQRYQKADEIVADLRALQSETTGTVKTVIVKERSKLPWILAAAAVLVIAAGLYLFMPGAHPTGANSKTIAVLPFANMSSDQKEDEYFSDGINEDILTQLAKIADLKVISRTSVIQYKGTKKTIREIGKELNAGVVLEGSVRRAGNQVRITAQLIDANTDEHLWADNYDREFKEVFTIQSEIAQKIASSLQAKLTTAEQARIANPATTKPEAYNAFLLGKSFFNMRGKENLEKAIHYFEQALSIDPGYAPAWADLAMVHASQADIGYILTDEGYRKARQEAEKALQLDPNLATAHSRMGLIQTNYDWDWSAADASFKRALELEPGNLSAIVNYSNLASTLGRFDEAMRLTRRAIELDPVRAVFYSNLGIYAFYAGQLDESEAAYKKSIEWNPKYSLVHFNLGLVYLEKGKPDSALLEMKMETEPSWQRHGFALVYHALGKKKEANNALDSDIKEFGDIGAYQIAEIYAYRGEADKSFEWLERAYKQRDGGLCGMKGDPLLRNIEKDPRYAVFMKKMKLPL
jgi:serine/threonine protein kinase